MNTDFVRSSHGNRNAWIESVTDPWPMATTPSGNFCNAWKWDGHAVWILATVRHARCHQKNVICKSPGRLVLQDNCPVYHCSISNFGVRGICYLDSFVTSSGDLGLYVAPKYPIIIELYDWAEHWFGLSLTYRSEAINSQIWPLDYSEVLNTLK